MKVKFLKYSIAALGLMLFAFGCKRTLDGFNQVGPSYMPAPEGFTVTGDTLTPAAASIDFSLAPGTTINFSATLSHSVTWTLTVVGQTSGATKTITGLSNSVNASWDGGADDVFFRVETVNAYLTFLGSTDTVWTSVSVTGTKLYNNQVVVDGSDTSKYYYVIDDFEGTTVLSAVMDANDGGNNFFIDNSRSISGNSSYTLSGTDNNGNFWGGDLGHEPTNGMAGNVNDPLNITDPSKYYLNIYVYGTGKPNTTMQIGTYEVDSDSNFALGAGYDLNANLADNDQWFISQEITWTGWKLVSVRYADFSLANASGPNGNKTKQPENIAGVRVSLASEPDPRAEIEFGIDFFVISTGGPFTP